MGFVILVPTKGLTKSNGEITSLYCYLRALLNWFHLKLMVNTWELSFYKQKFCSFSNMCLLYQDAFHQPIGITPLNDGSLCIIFISLATAFCHLERGLGFRKEKITLFQLQKKKWKETNRKQWHSLKMGDPQEFMHSIQPEILMLLVF